MKKRIFTGAGVAIVTPFKDDKVDFETLGKLIDFHIENKTDALIVCGTTGESATLEDNEHRAVIDYSVERAAHRIPVIAGTGSNNTSYACDLSRHAMESGVDGLLCVTPYYNKTSQKGLVRHYFAIADSTSLPVIVYNIPGRTGLNITPETYKELSAHPNIVATKEGNGCISSVIQTRHLCGDELDVYSGNDDWVVPILSIGGIGVISTTSNIMPREMHDMCSLYFEGKTEQSAQLQIKLIDIIDAMFCEVNPIPLKTAMGLMGLCSGEVRLPLCEMEDKNKDKLTAVLRKYELLK